MKAYRVPEFDEVLDTGHNGQQVDEERLRASDEDLISLTELATTMGKCNATALRWANVGTVNRHNGKRVRLETIDSTGGRRTSVRAYWRMIERLNERP
jgi:hypothetical protein